MRGMIAAALLLSISITSVTPSSGPVTGGTTVLIRGSGFVSCAQCTSVWFAGVPTPFSVLDAGTIQAKTPPFAPIAVDVSVVSVNGSASLPAGFTYLDENDDFERILLPIFTLPANGAFGSLFITYFSLWNTAGAEIPVFAFPPPQCTLATCPPQPPGPLPVILKARQGSPATFFQFDGNPGRLIYVPKGAHQRLAASLRVADLSRSNQSFGTRIPVVPESEFRDDFLALIDIPSSANFRNTLRVYSLDSETSVHVRVISSDSTRIGSEMDIDLRDPIDMLHSGYAQVSDLLTFSGGRIEIEPKTPGKRIWAFVSVTNNDTQQITVVAPH
jgi:hypothetical protein